MSALKNEIGNTYGLLTVIERASNGTNGKARWKCRCQCGNEIIVLGSDLRRGHTQSCGCYQKKRTSEANVKNLIGQTIGNFTVLESIQGVKTGGPSHSWRCKCNLCGREDVIITTHNIYRQYSCGCTIESKGERKIREILDNNNIEYIREKRFSDCIFPDTKYVARFDFYLPAYNIAIEYNGQQHYFVGTGMYDSSHKLRTTQEHDKIKMQYCKDHNIKLICIPFTEYDKINLNMLLGR